MADNLSKGPLRISEANADEINAVLQRVRDELDEIAGLRGPVTVNDAVTVPTVKVIDSNGNLIHGFGDV